MIDSENNLDKVRGQIEDATVRLFCRSDYGVVFFNLPRDTKLSMSPLDGEREVGVFMASRTPRIQLIYLGIKSSDGRVYENHYLFLQLDEKPKIVTDIDITGVNEYGIPRFVSKLAQITSREGMPATLPQLIEFNRILNLGNTN